MTSFPPADDVSRALRAEVPVLENETFVAALAQVARTAPPLASPRVPRWRVAAAAAALVLGLVGAAQAANRLSHPEPDPAPPSAPGIDDRLLREGEVNPDRGTSEDAPLRGDRRSGDSEESDAGSVRTDSEQHDPVEDDGHDQGGKDSDDGRDDHAGDADDESEDTSEDPIDESEDSSEESEDSPSQDDSGDPDGPDEESDSEDSADDEQERDRVSEDD